MNPVLETWLLLLVVIAGSVLAALSYSWGDSTLTLAVRFGAPPLVGFAAGRITASVALLAIARREAKG